MPDGVIGRGRGVLQGLLIALTGTIYLAVCADGAMAAVSKGFISTPTEQLAVPGFPESAQLTPSGSLFTGRFELTPVVGTSREPLVIKDRSGNYRAPEYKGFADVSGLRFTTSSFASEIDGQPVAQMRIRVSNRSSRSRSFHFGYRIGYVSRDATRRIRSYDNQEIWNHRFIRPASGPDGTLLQPGDQFVSGWNYSWANVLDRSCLDRSGSRLLCSKVSGRAKISGIRRDRQSKAVAKTSVGASHLFSGRIATGGYLDLDIVVPLKRIETGSRIWSADYGTQRRSMIDKWKAVWRVTPVINTPDPVFNLAYRASVQSLLVPRYKLADGRVIQAVNALNYRAYWLRDATMINRALLDLNLAAEAAENLAFPPILVQSDGSLTSRVGQNDGVGQFLWMAGEYSQRTGDSGFAREYLPNIERTVEWARQRLAIDPVWVLPASSPRDNEMSDGHLTGDLVWLAVGVQKAVEVARVAGDASRVADWQQLADRIAAIARARIRSAASSTGVVPPVLDRSNGRTWGELWLAWPGNLFAANDPIVKATMAKAAKDEREGIARWNGRLHFYLGFRRWNTELEAGNPRVAAAGLLASAAHLTASGGTWEQSSKAGGSRAIPDALGPHGWGSAEFTSLLIRSLALDVGSSKTRIFEAVQPIWLRPGVTTSFRRIKTENGEVGASLRATSWGARLTWSSNLKPGASLAFKVPWSVKNARAAGLNTNGEVQLNGASGSLDIRWKRTVTGLSATMKRRSILSAYK